MFVSKNLRSSRSGERSGSDLKGSKKVWWKYSEGAEKGKGVEGEGEGVVFFLMPLLRARGTQACAGKVSIIVVGGGAGLELCR